MRISLTARRSILASSAVLCVVAASFATAAEAPEGPARPFVTSGTGTLDVTAVAVPPNLVTTTDVLRWQVAAVDAQRLAAPASVLATTLVARPSTFDVALSRRDEARLASRADPESDFESRHLPEPGTWSAALATSALAAFFFLRRMS